MAHVRLVLIAMVGKLRLKANGLKANGIEALVETLKKECGVPKRDTRGEQCVWWIKRLIHFRKIMAF